MAVRYPDTPHTVDPAEIHNNFLFDRLIACVNQGRAPGELFYPHSVAVDSDTNQIYVADGLSVEEGPNDPEACLNSIARVSIFSEMGEFLDTFSHPDMKWPYGIAIHRNNVYVTDAIVHSVFHFKVEDFRFVARVGERGSGIGQFNSPRQLTVSTDGDVFVTDYFNNRVQILDSNLHYQRHISHHSMRYPCDVKLTPDEVYILCESSPFIKVFSLSGDLSRSLITRHDIGIRVGPSFFCLDANSNLLLSYRLNHQTKIFSKEGTLLHTLGKCGHKAGRFYFPEGIALINNRKLVIVSRSTNYCLQIFYSTT